MLASAMEEDRERVDRIYKHATTLALSRQPIPSTTTCAASGVTRLPSASKTTPRRRQPSSSSGERREVSQVSSAEAATIQEAILKELNYVRTDPEGYAKEMSVMCSHFEGTLYLPPSGLRIQTVEGVAAVEECIAYLNLVAAAPPMCLDARMSAATEDHVCDLGASGEASHTGSDGSSMTDRLDRYGEWVGTCGENIALGFATAREIVTQLLIDDDVPARGHRSNIMNSAFRVVGISVGPSVSLRHVCVMDYAGGFSAKVLRLTTAVTATTTGELTALVQQILNSIPMEAMKEEVLSVLTTQPLVTVTLNYTPTTITVIYNRPDGSSMTQNGSWGVKNVRA